MSALSTLPAQGPDATPTPQAETNHNTPTAVNPSHNGHLPAGPLPLPAAPPVSCEEATRRVNLAGAIATQELMNHASHDTFVVSFLGNAMAHVRCFQEALKAFRERDAACKHWSPETASEDQQWIDDPLRDLGALFFRAGEMVGFTQTPGHNTQAWAKFIRQGCRAANAEFDAQFDGEAAGDPALHLYSLGMIDSTTYATLRDSFRDAEEEDRAESAEASDYGASRYCAGMFRAGQWSAVVSTPPPSQSPAVHGEPPAPGPGDEMPWELSSAVPVAAYKVGLALTDDDQERQSFNDEWQALQELPRWKFAFSVHQSNSQDVLHEPQENQEKAAMAYLSIVGMRMFRAGWFARDVLGNAH